MKKWLLYLSGLTALLAGVFAWCLYLLHQSPTTRDMHNFFTHHQAGYEAVNNALLERLRAGESLDLDHNDTLGFSRVEASLEPSASVHYYTHYRGIGVASFGTGLAYLEQEPENLYDGIEAMQPDAASRERFTGYGRLTDTWYYFFWEAD